MSIDTTFLRRCIRMLEFTLQEIERHRETGETLHHFFRTACVKEYELAMEQCGKLLRKRLAAYFASNRQADRLAFKDLFRHAARHGLLETETVERWLRYRDHLNDTAHDNGDGFSDTTIKALQTFVSDAEALADMIEEAGDG